LFQESLPFDKFPSEPQGGFEAEDEKGRRMEVDGKGKERRGRSRGKRCMEWRRGKKSKGKEKEKRERQERSDLYTALSFYTGLIVSASWLLGPIACPHPVSPFFSDPKTDTPYNPTKGEG